MAEVDVSRFICSLIKAGRRYLSGYPDEAIENALSEQGLRFDGDDIVEMEQAPKWYKCIKDYGGFVEGELYCTNEYGDLKDPENKSALAIKNPCFKEWFCPAAEDEIEEVCGNKGETSPNCRLTEFEENVRNIVQECLMRESTNELGTVAFGVSIDDETTKTLAERLLDAARKQVLGECDAGASEMIKRHAVSIYFHTTDEERLMVTMETAAQACKVAVHNALKNVPTWRVAEEDKLIGALVWDSLRGFHLYEDRIHKGDIYISIADVLRLPGSPREE